jgi:L-asparagine oxygenase
MGMSLRKAVAKHGFALVEQHVPEQCTVDAVSQLGSVITLNGFLSVQSLRPRAVSSAPPNTYSGNFGTAEFPLHTDLAHWSVPPRYLALRCIKGAQSVATRVFDGNLIIKDIGVTLLRRILVQPRRPLRNGKQLMRLLDYQDSHGERILRWDSIFLCPATAESEREHSTVSKYIEAIVSKNVVLLAQGDTLIIDNWRMLHGRSCAPTTATDRQIDRVYMGDIS